MISKEQLAEIARQNNLALYQQEKEYLLKLFLYNYYKKFDDAVFKGGTCLRLAFGLDRFSEDLDFNITNPKKFQKQVKTVLKRIELTGVKTAIKKEEVFKKAFTAEISFQGPLFNGRQNSINKFRIDAGFRLGTLLNPEWNVLHSEFPEIPQTFLAKCLNEKELLAEKILALLCRKKGRDLFDAWFLLKKGVKFDLKLFEKKAKLLRKKPTISLDNIVSKKEYENDMRALTRKPLPYNEITEYLKKSMPEKNQ